MFLNVKYLEKLWKPKVGAAISWKRWSFLMYEKSAEVMTKIKLCKCWLSIKILNRFKRRTEQTGNPGRTNRSDDSLLGLPLVPASGVWLKPHEGLRFFRDVLPEPECSACFIRLDVMKQLKSFTGSLCSQMFQQQQKQQQPLGLCMKRARPGSGSGSQGFFFSAAELIKHVKVEPPPPPLWATLHCGSENSSFYLCVLLNFMPQIFIFKLLLLMFWRCKHFRWGGGGGPR